jgi:uncharacterized protein
MRLSMTLAVAALCSIIGHPASSGQAPALSATVAMRSVAESHVRPGYATLRDQSQALSGAMETLCAAPSTEAWSAAKSAFAATATSWGRIEFFRLGPVMAENRVERMLFFPDRKGTGLKQVQALIAEAAAPLPDAADLSTRSVALQGLGGLEFVLSGTGSDELPKGAPRRCAIGLAMANSVAAIAAELTDAWGPGSETERQWLDRGQGNTFARTDKEATNLLLGTVIHGLEAVRDLRLKPVLGKDGAADRPKSALFWRSGLTMPMAIANLEGARDLFERAMLSSAVPPEKANIAAMVRFAFRQSIMTAQALDGPIEAALANPETRDRLAYLALSVDQLIGLLDREFAPAAGLATGFSFGDGD